MKVAARTATPTMSPANRTPADLLAAARNLTQSLLTTPPSERSPLRAQRRTLLAAAARMAADQPGDSDPDADELLKRARGGWTICGCGKPDTPGHKCDSLTGVAAALDRTLAVVGQVQREQEQAIAEQVEAAYAEYADQPKAEYRDWARSAA